MIALHSSLNAMYRGSSSTSFTPIDVVMRMHAKARMLPFSSASRSRAPL
jgi:hypothetical protein